MLINNSHNVREMLRIMKLKNSFADHTPRTDYYEYKYEQFIAGRSPRTDY